MGLHLSLKNKPTMKTSTNDSSDCIIILENEQTYIKAFKDLFEDLKINLRLIPCLTTGKYEEELKIAKENNTLKCIIMDLSNTNFEEDTKKYKASEYIRNEFDENRIPIFIYSGNLEHYSDLQDKGTVFKVDKSSSSGMEEICDKIKEMEDSDFFNIFCRKGKLEEKIMSEIHNSFIEQFKGNEISDIIKSIKSVEDIDVKKRTTEVFERMAIRAVYENWISAKSEEGSINEVKLNSIEHYYRRTSPFDFWTGDIFANESNKCIVLTPRCNVGHKNFNQLLLCCVESIDEAKIKELTGKKGLDKLQKNITDHQIVGERFRFLPPTPQFKGGLVDFKTVFTKSSEDFIKDWYREITLSDELTNDVVRKFTAYNLRGGISETEFNEAHYYVSNITNEEE